MVYADKEEPMRILDPFQPPHLKHKASKSDPSKLKVLLGPLDPWENLRKS